MKIGIDARPLISEYPTGIGLYLNEILKLLQEDRDNEYYLYSNSTLSSVVKPNKRMKIRVQP